MPRDSVEKWSEKSHDIKELKGLGKEIWREIDIDEYIRKERETWDGKID